jgi:sigma-E factor negative regulatory protein RseB
MSRAWPVLLAGLFLAVLPPMVLAERTPQEWLDHMTRSMRESNYTGTFVYRYGDRLEAMRIAHRAGPDGRRERLRSLSGRRREIIRDGQAVTCVFADRDAVVVDRRQTRNPLSDLVPSGADTLGQNYQLDVAGVGRIADREVIRLRIKPRDGYRYGYELAIDREAGLLLGSQLLEEGEGSPVEQIMFTSVAQPEDIPDSALEQSISGDGFVWHRRDTSSDGVSEVSDDSQWTVGSVPPGFQLDMRERHTLPGRDVMVEHWLYTDGLASVSVYIERTGNEIGAFHGRSRMGALNVYGRKVEGYQVVVVGEVPAVTVESMGRSIEQKNGAGP